MAGHMTGYESVSLYIGREGIVLCKGWSLSIFSSGTKKNNITATGPITDRIRQKFVFRIKIPNFGVVVRKTFSGKGQPELFIYEGTLPSPTLPIHHKRDKNGCPAFGHAPIRPRENLRRGRQS
jgi:hypothetical protein